MFSVVSNNHARTRKCDFSASDQKYRFGQIWPKISKLAIKVKFGTYANSNMHNSMEVFNFSVLDREHSFSANLITKIKIVSLR